LLVTMPAGSGHAEALHASPLVMERDENTKGHPMLPSACHECPELEAALASLRSQHAEELEHLRSRHSEELERERSEWQQRVHFCEEVEQRSAEQLQAEGRRYGEEWELHLERSARLKEEASSVRRLRRELAEEAREAEGAARWQQLALEASSQLAEAETQCEESEGSAARCRRRAAAAGA